MSILGAIAIDYLHHRDLWSVIRYPVAVVALLTLYVCLNINFVRYAPDSSEAQWARHALLFWISPTTTLQARSRCEAALEAARASGLVTVKFADDEPVLKWYLRDLKQVARPEDAGVVIEPASGAPQAAANYQSDQFVREESWQPDFSRLTKQKAVLYLLTERAWTDLRESSTTLLVNVSAPGETRTARTFILSPASPGPAPTPKPQPQPR